MNSKKIFDHESEICKLWNFFESFGQEADLMIHAFDLHEPACFPDPAYVCHGSKVIVPVIPLSLLTMREVGLIQFKAGIDVTQKEITGKGVSCWLAVNDKLQAYENPSCQPDKYISPRLVIFSLLFLQSEGIEILEPGKKLLVRNNIVIENENLGGTQILTISTLEKDQKKAGNLMFWPVKQFRSLSQKND